MANRFTDSFAQNGNYISNFLANQGINLPNEYRNANPEQIAKYLLDSNSINVPQQYQNNPVQVFNYLMGTIPAGQQNFVMQKVNMLKGMFGMR